ncbi:hypothetical protein ACIA5G_50740 [Amycolatopsis sp. NPDC051758]|uniref:hypothetical protein n=1 Tax=Amycolatopsis sp. NPDC051758 TaxID=3363935 RepID=UPI00379C35B7
MSRVWISSIRTRPAVCTTAVRTPASGTSNCSTTSVKPSVVGDDPDRVVMAVLAVLR